MSYRTHLGGDLRAADVGTRVTLSGWVARRRDHGGLCSWTCATPAARCSSCSVPSSLPEAHTLRNEFVIQVEGDVHARDPENVNPKLATGQIEVQVGGMEVLARAAVLPFQLDDEGVDEPLRLRHRYLDLRRDEMRKNLWVRFKLTQLIRRYLEDRRLLGARDADLV